MENSGVNAYRCTRTVVLLLALAGGLSVPGTGAAAVLFNQPPNGDEAIVSSIDSGVQNADNFSFSSPVTLNAIRWWGSYFSDPDAGSDAFTVRLFADDNGAPAANPLMDLNDSITRSATSLTLPPQDAPVFQYDMALSNPIDLQVGTYYLSVMNDNTGDLWAWMTSDDDALTLNWYRSSDGEDWNSDPSFDFAFALSGERQGQVPEPGTLALIGAVICAAVVSHRRRRRTDLAAH
jgi:hypothetical protein